MGRSAARLALLILAAGALASPPPAPAAPYRHRDVELALPAPRKQGDLPVEAALAARRSRREYRPDPLALAELGQLLWAAQGVTSPRGLRTAPSAGATYPLELLAVTGAVEGLMPGVYRYRPAEHAMERIADGDLRNALHMAAMRQAWVRDAPVTFVFTLLASRIERKYGARARDFACIELGHAAENLMLQAEALGMGAVAVGAFGAAEVRRLLKLEAEEEPLYLVPAGKK